MAAQLKPHTVDQIRGLRTNKAKCPCCSEPAFVVLESRKVPEGIRRRHTCEKCFYRETRFEISNEAYQELKELRIALKHIKNSLERTQTYVKPEDVDLPCTTCAHKTKFGCSFDYPEAETVDAIGCTQYSKA
jgi:C4-type Zn-finger protein